MTNQAAPFWQDVFRPEARKRFVGAKSLTPRLVIALALISALAMPNPAVAGTRALETEIDAFAALCEKMAKADPAEWPTLAFDEGLQVASQMQVREVLRTGILTEAAHSGSEISDEQLDKYLDMKLGRYISLGDVLRRKKGKLLPFVNASGTLLSVKDRLGVTKGVSGLVIKCDVQVKGWLSKSKAESAAARITRTEKADVLMVFEETTIAYRLSATQAGPGVPRSKSPLRAEIFSVRGKADHPGRVGILIEHRNVSTD